MKASIKQLLNCVILFALFVATPLYANDQTTQTDAPSLSQGEIAQVLAPIALYPDSLLTHILIASTYPIEIIEANRWVEKHPDVKPENIAEQVKGFEWDPSIVALIGFPTVLEKMSEELTWTQQLGDAFLQDEALVLATIQSLRAEADKAGNLDKMENVKVVKEQKTIIIEPAEKEVVYVPYYDTRVVYGGWHWAHYPPVYWHHPVYVHHVHHSPFYWHTGVHISFNFFFSDFHWHNHHVVVSHHHKHHYSHRRHVSHGGYANAKRWHHNPTHRRGVAYHSKAQTRKYHSSRPSRHYTKTVRVQEKHNGVRATKQVTTVTRHKSLQNKVKKTNTHVVSTRQTGRTKHVSPSVKKQRDTPKSSKQKYTQPKQNKANNGNKQNSRYVKTKSTPPTKNKYQPNQRSTPKATSSKPKQYASNNSTSRRSKQMNSRSNNQTRNAKGGKGRQ